ncbi:MAG: aminomethyl-transferring glycine dehydrogenase subunit GcvPB [Rhodospirillaceae bacterium]|jgi:glycine dehydrogenase subunit 2|nr:aminomethyl-transferring glycine dehydrogenase subunit GcvPB [Rhodospirillaceae bacterium]MBT4772921.1 aminomethyl-transferring glycine dehydrogenase subunit GcvPB [Rhodospirillaceae bacterium]MBT5358286.1 aminomethyl-transferring glycine dehydrogenase subunit GcvPB [Rhodospirillaceae bacterium]MBT5767941.1 aminomethyl-transferring glycine dehydrogenase subunit GcvPB [Rhodospirillaceae bacterium]MBT6310262.1 aminomethyl-transferring glycine dehydrogenase subunit GcvPB [Rhodospirillaceae bact
MSGHSKDLSRSSPTTPVGGPAGGLDTVHGHQGLRLEEPLLFEIDNPGAVGVDLPDPGPVKNRLGGLERNAPIGLPSASEPEIVRHFTRLSQKNYAIDMGTYPLGSCTMKHNPRLNEKVVRLPGFANLHPMQPDSTTQGALELIDSLAHWLKELTGMPAVAMSPAAGAHGELCGVMAIRAALDDREGGPTTRRRILVPDSAHGTNPATAAACGFAVDAIPSDARGRVDVKAFADKLDDDVAGIMITNPNTCGLFENDMIEIAGLIHDVGGYFYCDGANFNAIVGRVRPGDLGIDCMHINLHKTFSTPHGGGGPGAGPVVLSDALAPFAPTPWVVHGDEGFALVEHGADAGAAKPFGRLKGFHGQMGMFIRAYAYMLSHGRDGLRQVANDAVLNANYVMAQLSDVMTTAFDGPCMHECLFDDRFLKDSGVTTLDFAKAMIDEGYHPMTMYFPLVVHGAMLIEPTETESKRELDNFIAVVRSLAARVQAGDGDSFAAAPRLTPRRRLDETAAARSPVLRWMPEIPTAEAAE